MDIKTITELITTLGFPIVCVIALAWFAFYLVRKSNEDNAKNMETVQARCAAREEKLYQQIEKFQEVNAQAIGTITLYAERLDEIEHDVKEVKDILTAGQ